LTVVSVIFYKKLKWKNWKSWQQKNDSIWINKVIMAKHSFDTTDMYAEKAIRLNREKYLLNEFLNS